MQLERRINNVIIVLLAKLIANNEEKDIRVIFAIN